MDSEKNPRIIICDCDHVDVEMEKSVFRKAGEDFKWLHCTTQDEVIEKCKGAVVFLNQYAPMDAKVFEAIPTLKCIVRYGVGVDNVNLEDADKYGVQVCNVPDYGMNEVADQAMALMLSVYRKVWYLGNDTRKGNWNFANGKKIHRPETMTVGIIGTGRIGREVAKRAHAFNFHIVAFDKFYVEHTKPEERLPFITYVDTLEELLKTSDIVTLHCGLDQSNFHMMNKAAFARMKQDSYLINVSRGGLVDEDALYEAIVSGKLAGAGLDVFNHEPLDPKSPLFTCENCVITPHVAWYSEEASQQLKHDCATLAVAFLKGEIGEEKYKKNRVNNK